MKNMYALLVGLNNYQETFNKLNGCVPDIERVEKYLTNVHGLDADRIKTLKNEEATKNAIVAQFRQHLGQVKDGDTALFYFAGHGVLQVANPSLLSSVMNNKFECLVCYDTTWEGSNLLADKELRWLIHELNQKSEKAHIVCIFDCCHSGDNTRSIGDDTDAVARLIKDEYGEKIMQMREWNEFIFADKSFVKNVVTEEMVAEAINKPHGTLDDILPQGVHIQIAACSSNELAKETYPDDPEHYGHFSHHFLEFLEATQGKITYYDLRSLIYQNLNRLPEKKRQAPQFYAVGTSIFQPVFGGFAVEQEEVMANIFYHKTNYRWEMDMGSIYGIPESSPDAAIQIFVKLDTEGSQTEAVAIEKVFSDYAILRILSTNTRLDKQKTYQASVRKFMQKTLKVACVAENAKDAWQSFCKDNPQQLTSASVEWVGDVSSADYVVYTEGGSYWVALPDKPKLPLAEQVYAATANEAFESMLKQLSVMSRWSFVKEHKNALYSGNLLDYIELTFEQGTTKQNLNGMEKFELPLKNGFELDGNVYWSNDSFTLRVKNTHPTDTMHLAGAWLTELFGINSGVINESPLSTPLQAGKSTFIAGENTFINYKAYLKEFGWEKFSNTIKLFVSKKPFGLTHYQQLDLNPPIKNGSRGDLGSRPDRVSNDAVTAARIDDWTVKTVTFEVDIRD